MEPGKLVGITQNNIYINKKLVCHYDYLTNLVEKYNLYGFPSSYSKLDLIFNKNETIELENIKLKYLVYREFRAIKYKYSKPNQQFINILNNIKND